MSKTMTWNYKGEADITLGEVHASPLPKILTALIVLAVIVVGILAFIQRDFIYDTFTNPHIVLTQESVNIPYNGTFDPYQYIDKTKTLKYNEFIDYRNIAYFAEGEIEQPYSLIIDYDIDTTKVGQTFIVKYLSSNRVNSSETTLKVNIIDDIPPTVILNKEEYELHNNDLSSFNIENFIKDAELSDNYSDVTLCSYIITDDSNNEISEDDIRNMYIDADIKSLASDCVDGRKNFIDLKDEFFNKIILSPYNITYTFSDTENNTTSVSITILINNRNDIETICNNLSTQISEEKEIRRQKQEEQNSSTQHDTTSHQSDDSQDNTENPENDNGTSGWKPSGEHSYSTYDYCPYCGQYVGYDNMSSHYPNCPNKP